MEDIQNVIPLNYTDREINQLIKSFSGSESKVSKHFNQNEEFFLKLDTEFFVPSFPIHHDVRLTEPTTRYLETLKIFLKGVVPLVPQIFTGLTYFFDPTDILRPGFFQLYKMGDVHYLYMLKIDLSFKTHEHQLIQRGTNDNTAEFRSVKLFLDGTVIPLNEVQTKDNKVTAFDIRQTVSQIWIGETGRGYFVQGIWIDHELTKFFSKLFLPPRKRVYPYYPFQCKYRTVCFGVINMDADSRKKYPPQLHKAVQFVEPIMDTIQDSVRDADFAVDLPVFQDIKKRVPEFWNTQWDDVAVKPYLNENDMKEFVVESGA